MKCGYSVVVFDFWETLVHRPLRKSLYTALAKELDVDHEEVLEVALFTLFRSQEFSLSEFAARLAKFLRDHDEAYSLASRIEHLVRGHETADQTAQWIPRARELLKDLHDHSVHLVLAANGTVRSRELAQSLQVADYFDEMLFSCTLGVAKPNPAFFLHSRGVEDAIGAGRRVCVVGDQFDRDVLGAQMLGVDAILFRQASATHKEGPRWYDCGPRIGMAHDYNGVRRLLFRA